jgi:hypothetical protein
MSTDLSVLLDKALKALPPKSPVRAEIVEALKQRAAHSERAAKAWATMKANRKAKAEPLAATPTRPKATRRKAA